MSTPCLQVPASGLTPNSVSGNPKSVQDDATGLESGPSLSPNSAQLQFHQQLQLHLLQLRMQQPHFLGSGMYPAMSIAAIEKSGESTDTLLEASTYFSTYNFQPSHSCDSALLRRRYSLPQTTVHMSSIDTSQANSAIHGATEMAPIEIPSHTPLSSESENLLIQQDRPAPSLFFSAFDYPGLLPSGLFLNPESVKNVTEAIRCSMTGLPKFPNTFSDQPSQQSLGALGIPLFSPSECDESIFDEHQPARAFGPDDTTETDSDFGCHAPSLGRNRLDDGPTGFWWEPQRAGICTDAQANAHPDAPPLASSWAHTTALARLGRRRRLLESLGVSVPAGYPDMAVPKRRSLSLPHLFANCGPADKDGPHFMNGGTDSKEKNCPDDTNALICHCGRGPFASRGSLRVHMRSHSATKNTICPVCQKQFQREQDLRRHSAAHVTTATLGIFCEICGVSFTRNDALRRHQKKMICLKREK